METPTRTDPPYVPIRKTGWAGQRKAPRWMLLAGLLIVVGAVLVAEQVAGAREGRGSEE